MNVKSGLAIVRRRKRDFHPAVIGLALTLLEGLILQTKFVEANGLRFEVLGQGIGDRLALCLHGFPEHAISVAAPDTSARANGLSRLGR